MGSFSVWHWLIVLVIVLVLFGRGKIPELMGDVAKGIKSFKKGMADEDGTPRAADRDTTPEPTTTDHAKTVDHKADELK